MKFDVYCDESRPDLLCSKNASAKYMVIGSLWLKYGNRDRFKKSIYDIKENHHIGGEFKWQKVSRCNVEFYRDLIKWFCSMKNHLRFRCIVVKQSQIDLKLYHESDQELGFYKFYYQLLHHWILDCNEYNFFLDCKCNRRRNRLPVLRQCLDHSNLSSTIKNVQAIESNQSLLIQLADILTGAASTKLNDSAKQDGSKAMIIQTLEKCLGHELKHTKRNEQKFNIFKINLQGGW